MRSTSWLTDDRREMAVELHRELLESGPSHIRRRLKASAPVEAPSLVDAGAAWDEETPVDIGLDEETEPEALWRALAELEAEPAERLPEPPRGPHARRRTPSSPWGIVGTPPEQWRAEPAACEPNQWPATEWGMPSAPTQPDHVAAKARAHKRLAQGTADPTLEPLRAFDVLVTARRSSHVLIARRELPTKATSRPMVLSAWDMRAQSTRRHAIKLVAFWAIGIALVCAGLLAAGMAMP